MNKATNYCPACGSPLSAETIASRNLAFLATMEAAIRARRVLYPDAKDAFLYRGNAAQFQREYGIAEIPATILDLTMFEYHHGIWFARCIEDVREASVGFIPVRVLN